jgi:uroporphyrinogen decarboxylase
MTNALNRRNFLKTASLTATSALVGFGGLSAAANAGIGAGRLPKRINKRDAVLSLIDSTIKQDYIPAGFFIHFDKDHKWGQAAIDKHLEFFNKTDMDIVKIQYENTFPFLEEIKNPADWKKMPLYGKDFYAKQLEVVKGLVQEMKKNAIVIVTIYSPFMCAGHTTSDKMITEHLKQDPESVKAGMEIITESLLIFARECIKLGADGFLSCTQGAESNRFGDQEIFNKYIKPYDLALYKEVHEYCNLNILHICDYNGDYDDLKTFSDYPGHIVNCSQKLGSEIIETQKFYKMFARPFMGGINKRGIIVDGSQVQIEAAVKKVLDNAPEKFMLGASCTLPGDIKWANIRTAIDIAHNYKK